MFIQVIEGATKDAAALHRQLEKWDREVRPGTAGYLGSTGGCTSAGDFILIARFESRDAAERNSDRPEQGAWWKETEQYFDGPVSFHDTEDVQVMMHGDLDRARFVQVMDGHVSDPDRAMALGRESEPLLAELRPELLGAVTAFYGDEFTELAYFTSAEEAHLAESKELPAHVAPMMAEWQRLMKVDRYLDIDDPWLLSV